MKETQIAKENVEKLKLLSDKVDWQFCKEHLKSCQRFLEFLKSGVDKHEVINVSKDRFSSSQREIIDKIIDKINKSFLDWTGLKITDLQGAIKVYEDGGVR